MKLNTKLGIARKVEPVPVDDAPIKALQAQIEVLTAEVKRLSQEKTKPQKYIFDVNRDMYGVIEKIVASEE